MYTTRRAALALAAIALALTACGGGAAKTAEPTQAQEDAISAVMDACERTHGGGDLTDNYLGCVMGVSGAFDAATWRDACDSVDSAGLHVCRKAWNVTRDLAESR